MAAPGVLAAAPGRRRFTAPAAPPDLVGARYAVVQRLIAVVAAFLLGLHYIVHGGVSIGDAIAPLMLAVWAPALRRFRWAWFVVILGLFAVVWGWSMGNTAILDGYAITSSWRLQTTAELASVILGAAVLLWARTVVPTWVIGLSFGIGTVGNAVLFAPPSDNAWKFTWAVPVILVVLSLAAATGWRWAGPAAIVVLAIISAAMDCRSYSAALALTLVLYLAVIRPGTGRLPTAAVAGFVVALAGAVYYLGTSLLVSGYLGRGAQARTIAQIDTSGSLILGGRPEISATWALMKHRPGGYGAGVVPTGHDVIIAKTGLRSINYDPNNGYVEQYMFGGHIELHSNFGDLWANFGIPGLLLIAVVAVVALRGIAIFISRRSGSALMIFTCVWALWNVGFSPFTSSSAVMTLAIVFALPEVGRTRTAPGFLRQWTKTASRRTPAADAASPSDPADSPALR